MVEGLNIVRFNGIYYIRFVRSRGSYENLGHEIIEGIPTDPDVYPGWLESMRAKYRAIEKDLEKHVYKIRASAGPDYARFREFQTLPCPFARPVSLVHYTYIINLDREIFTINRGMHWKLGDIPRENHLWYHAIKMSIEPCVPTISLDICPERYMGSPALDYPEKNQLIKYKFRCVLPRKDVAEPRKAFLTTLLAATIDEYKDEIMNFGKEWSPDSFPFRELIFAFVSIAAGCFKLHSFPARLCHPRRSPCAILPCPLAHLRRTAGCVGEEWTGRSAPLPEFGSLSHLPGKQPGASPQGVFYWFEEVIVSLVLVVDGQSITDAINWGIEQRRSGFLIVVISLFEVAFAELTYDSDLTLLVRVTGAISLSPLREDRCLSTHPRERPELRPGMQSNSTGWQTIMSPNHTATVQRLSRAFPGFAALVNFFEIAADRRAARAASKSRGILPLEIYEMILDFVDFDTWQACSHVSSFFRSSCLRKYRVDDRVRLVGSPYSRRESNLEPPRPKLFFNFENVQNGTVFPMTQDRDLIQAREYNWMPIIGGCQKVIMLDLDFQFNLPGADHHEAYLDDEGVPSDEELERLLDK